MAKCAPKSKGKMDKKAMMMEDKIEKKSLDKSLAQVGSKKKGMPSGLAAYMAKKKAGK